MNKKAYIDKYCWDEIKKIFDTDYYSLKLIVYILANLNPDNLDQKKISNLSFDLIDIAKCMDLSGENRLKIIKDTFVTIKQTIIEMDNQDYWEPVSFFDNIIIEKSKKIATVSINKHFLPFLSDLKRFLSIRIQTIGLSHRQFIFYCRLKATHSKNIYKISFNEIQSYCDLSYKTVYDFKRHFLDKAIENFSKVGIKLTYKIENSPGDKHFTFNLEEDSQIDNSESLQSEKVTITESKSDLVNHVPETRKTLKKPFEAEIKEVYDHYMTVFNRDNRYTLTPDRQAVIRARLEEKYTVEELKKHIDLHKKSDFHNGVNEQKKFYIDLKEHIFNKTKFDTRQQNIEAVKPKKDVYVKPIYSDTIPKYTDEQVIESIDFVFFVEKYYIKGHNSAFSTYRKPDETFPQFWLRTMDLRR